MASQQLVMDKQISHTANGSKYSTEGTRKCSRIPSANKTNELTVLQQLARRKDPTTTTTTPRPNRDRTSNSLQLNKPQNAQKTNVVRQQTNIIRKRSRSNLEINRKKTNSVTVQRPSTVNICTKPQLNKEIPVLIKRSNSKSYSSCSINIVDSSTNNNRAIQIGRNSKAKIKLSVAKADIVKRNHEKQTLELQLSARKKNYNSEKKKLQDAQFDLFNLYKIITDLQSKLNKLTGRNDRQIEQLKLVVDCERCTENNNKENNFPDKTSSICEHFKRDLQQLHETGFKLCQQFMDINHNLIQDLKVVCIVFFYLLG